jgi:hypothetical protein
MVVLGHSTVYSHDMGGGNSPISLFDTVKDELTSTFYCDAGLHDVAQGNSSNVYCIGSYWQGKSRLARLTFNSSFQLDRIADIPVQGTSLKMDGSVICNPVSNIVWVSDAAESVIKIFNADRKKPIGKVPMPYSSSTGMVPVWMRYYAPLDYVITGHKGHGSSRITVHSQATHALVTNFNWSYGFDVKNNKLYVYNEFTGGETPSSVDIYDITNRFKFMKTIVLK